jgi:hypothetical protein
MITKQEAMKLKHGDILHHVSLKGSDKLPVRIRVMGKPIEWKTRPTEFRVPCCHGLRNHLDLTHRNAGDWEVA